MPGGRCLCGPAWSIDLQRQSALLLWAWFVNLRLVSAADRWAWLIDSQLVAVLPLQVWSVSLPLVSAADRQACLIEFALVSAPAARAYFLLFAQKKVAKEKGTPGSAPGKARCLALLASAGGLPELACGSNMASRLPPRSLRCSAPRKGPGRTSRVKRSGKTSDVGGVGSRKDFGFCPFFRVDRDNFRFCSFRHAATSFRVPMCRAEQRRGAGGCRLALFEPKASLASRPVPRVAQGTRRSRAQNLGSPFLWLLSFGEAKESTPAGQRRKPAANPPSSPAAELRKPAVKKQTTPAAEAQTQTAPRQPRSPHRCPSLISSPWPPCPGPSHSLSCPHYPEPSSPIAAAAIYGWR